MLGEVAPNAVRIVLLPLVALIGLPDVYIAHVLTLSVLLPWLFVAPRLGDRSIGGVSTWKRWDYTYSGKFVVATLFANQLGVVDILVMSVLFSSETVGDYAIAARIAGLFSFFQIVMLKRFAPRAGEILARGDMAALRSEAEACRRITIGCGALTIGGMLFLAPYLLPLFGNFAGALGFLTLLAIPAFMQSFYATSDRLLIIAGHANVALILTASSFAVLTVSPVRDGALARADRRSGGDDRIRYLIQSDRRDPRAAAVRHPHLRVVRSGVDDLRSRDAWH